MAADTRPNGRLYNPQATILRLRDELRRGLDSRLHIRRFHDAVLRCGSMSLAVRRSQVAAYVADAGRTLSSRTARPFTAWCENPVDALHLPDFVNRIALTSSDPPETGGGGGRMTEGDLEYYRRRRDKELALAATATSPEAQSAHAELAMAYAERVRRLIPREPRLRLVVSNPPAWIHAAA